MSHVDFDAISQKMHEETDRASAILGAAALDANLEGMFRTRLSCNQDELLHNSGPLASFSARIKLAHGLKWISNDVAHDMDVIRHIRNGFAHNFDIALSFETQSFSDRCNNLRTAKAFLEGFEIGAEQPNRNISKAATFAMRDKFLGPRWRYQLAVDFLIQHLDQIVAGSIDAATHDILVELRNLSANTLPKISGRGTVR